MVDAAPDKTLRFGDLIRQSAFPYIVGAAEQVADELERWHVVEGGIDGLNLIYHHTRDLRGLHRWARCRLLQQRGLSRRSIPREPFPRS